MKSRKTKPAAPARLRTWVEMTAACHFTIHNIPFGIYRSLDGTPRVCSAIGNFILDLSVLADNSYFKSIAGLTPGVFRAASLNSFIELGKECTGAVRSRIMHLLSDDNDELQARKDIRDRALIPMASVTMMMPVKVGDYTDFYSSREHASNIGSMLRDAKDPLPANWLHLPAAYHGRASSIVVSGTPVHRPAGQFRRKGDDVPSFGPTERLDYELEIGFVIGRNSLSGERIGVDEAESFIFGYLLFNDWSARDIQSWEYVPLGPFLSKNFLSSVSPWIVTTEALAPFRVPGPKPAVQLLPYLQSDGPRNYDIGLEVSLARKGKSAEVISNTNFRYMYWNACQQLAHHTVTGCNVCVGDILASGTISGPGEREQGSLMELSRNGETPLVLSDGSTRAFLEDGDTVVMTAVAQKGELRVGFGEVSGTVMPAMSLVSNE